MLKHLLGVVYFLGLSTLAAEDVDFARDVRPILADACFHCHGPDEESREADLRLDIASDASAVIQPNMPEESEVWNRIASEDPDLVMPPPDSGKSLTAEQKELLHQWISEGARFQAHWAFEPPRRPSVPTIADDQWSQNPVDNFVLQALAEEGLQPSEQADALTLVRRLSLDLVGLPPKPEFARQWAARLEADDADGSAYQALINELLRSEHYGEKWARMWLDAARYADSDGYEKDKPRTVWFYRDWVIDSFNQDRPYDDFIIRQIAGDLLPNATQDDLVATGFLRNSMVNEEGGADPEQFRMEAMYDRMDAVGKAVLGLTIQCAQCHTHKYDPLQQRDYYRMFACLNNTHDAIVSVYSEGELAQRSKILADIANWEQEIKDSLPDWQQRLADWADKQNRQSRPEWTVPKLEFSDTSLGGSKFLRQADGSYLCQSYAPTNFKPQMTGKYERERLTGMQLELLKHPNLPRGGPGRSVDGTWALSEVTVEVALSGKPTEKRRLKIARAVADRSPESAELKPRYDNKKKDKRTVGGIEFAIDGDEKTAWTNETDSPLSNSTNRAWFEFEEPLEIPTGQYALVTVSLAQRHGGWNSDDNQTFNVGCYRLSLTGDALPVASPLPIAIEEIISRPPEAWSEADSALAFSYWIETLDETESWCEKIAAAWQSHPMGTTQLSLQERDDPRETYLLGRGDFLNPVEAVQAGVPEFLHPLEPSDEAPRLQFARWLASKKSPTTARSIVNRIWQEYFGVGLVETSDDLGTQSAPPSHPELLDFLAMELMDSGWSIKHLQRIIVASATYRQSANVTEELYRRDPYNRLLARGARYRVSAETVRDIALVASGLLNPQVGGRSVYPPAPSFLFVPPVSYGPKKWDVEQDSQRYRRALYTFRFRSVLYPMLENFDAVNCNVACVRRPSSNTPMQALTALNEPLFQECAVAMANRVLKDRSFESDQQRIVALFWRCVSREPTQKEAVILGDYVRQQRARIASGELDAKVILAATPEEETEGLNVEELATWALVSRVCLNLDETITRN